MAAALQAAPSFAQVPGTPGVPQAGQDIWIEDFTKGTPLPDPAVRLYNQYLAADGTSYYSDPTWRYTANECNGWILNAGTSAPTAGQDTGCLADGGQSANGTSHDAWFYLQAMASVLGGNVLASMTNNGGAANPAGGGTIQIRANTVTTTEPIVEGHFYVSSAELAAVHCQQNHPPGVTWSDPAETLTLFVDGSPLPAASIGVDTCTVGTAVDYDPGPVNQRTPIYVAQINSPAWLSSGVTPSTTVGIQVTDTTYNTTGNDQAIGKLKITDVTPQLDKSFDPALAPVNGTSTLTFTITNTAELAAKDGWSFTDTLSSGLVVAPTPNASATCTDGTTSASALGTSVTVTAAAGADSITVKGDLDDGIQSCVVTVDVTSATEAAYTNDDSNVLSPIGVWPPGSSQVKFTGADMEAIVVSGPTPASPGSSDMTVVTKCVNNGPLEADNPTCDVVVTGAAGTTTCTPPPSSPLAVGDEIVCTTTYTQGAAPVKVTTTAGSTTYDPNPNNNVVSLIQPNSGAAPATSVPTGKELPWLLLLLLTATAWYAMAKRNSRR